MILSAWVYSLKYNIAPLVDDKRDHVHVSMDNYKVNKLAVSERVIQNIQIGICQQNLFNIIKWNPSSPRQSLAFVFIPDIHTI